METKKVTKLAKQVILGKNKPTPILRFLCWFTLIWDSLLALYFGGSGLVFLLSQESFSANPILKDFTKEFCFTLAGLHVVSLFSATLMYRLKRNGFFLYLFSNLAMVVLPFFYLKGYTADYIVVVFTLTLIALFASQYKKLS